MLDIKAINHVGIRIADQENSVSFYGNLGFELVSDTGFADGHPIIMKHPGGVVLNLLGPANASEGTNILMDVDTGMGLERITAVLQGVESNYDTDLFLPLLAAIRTTAGAESAANSEKEFSLRVIADHLRSIAFLIADGVVPANDNRGYVLRRILRRGIRHGRKLGVEDPFLFTLTDRVVETMGDAYPELREAGRIIAEICRREEERFRDTFQISSRRMEELLDRLVAAKQDTVPGDEMFRLYDTFGMPVDFQEEMAQERGLGLDRDGFEQQLDKQRQRARRAMRGGTAAAVPETYRDLLPGGRTPFHGYRTTTLNEAKVLAIVAGGQSIQELCAGQEGEVLLEETPFYPEGGGQIGDRGRLASGRGVARVVGAHSPAAGVMLHRVHQESGSRPDG